MKHDAAFKFFWQENWTTEYYSVVAFPSTVVDLHNAHIRTVTGHQQYMGALQAIIKNKAPEDEFFCP